MGSRAKLYAVVGAGSVTGMFTARELLQRGGNVRCVMRDPERYKGELEEMIAYFPRGKRGNMEYCAADVTKPETLPAGAPARRGVSGRRMWVCAVWANAALWPREARAGPRGARGGARTACAALRSR
jgi:NAD(P)-dependent dehydrogenase (short-subunit alcohol dehydrogenase family)